MWTLFAEHRSFGVAYGLTGTGGRDVHLDFHTAPQFCLPRRFNLRFNNVDCIHREVCKRHRVSNAPYRLTSMEGRAWDSVRQESKDWGSCWVNMPMQLTMTVSKFRFTCLCSWPWTFQSSDSHACGADHGYFKVQIQMPVELTMTVSKFRFTCLCSWLWMFQSWDSHACGVDHEYFKVEIRRSFPENW